MSTSLIRLSGMLILTLTLALTGAGCGGGDDTGTGFSQLAGSGGGGGEDPGGDTPDDPVVPPSPPPPTGPDAPDIDLATSVTSDEASVELTADVTGATGYEWITVAGPGPVVFGPTDAVPTTLQVAFGGTYTIRLTATGDGGSASKDIEVVIAADRYALSGSVVDSDGGTADAVNLDWTPLGAQLASREPSGSGEWRFDDLVAPVDQLSVRVPGRD